MHVLPSKPEESPDVIDWISKFSMVFLGSCSLRDELHMMQVLTSSILPHDSSDSIVEWLKELTARLSSTVPGQKMCKFRSDSMLAGFTSLLAGLPDHWQRCATGWWHSLRSLQLPQFQVAWLGRVLQRSCWHSWIQATITAKPFP